MKMYFQQERCRQKTFNAYLDLWEVQEQCEVAQGEEVCDFCNCGYLQATQQAQLSKMVARQEMVAQQTWDEQEQQKWLVAQRV
jgi:hypothetical protein